MRALIPILIALALLSPATAQVDPPPTPGPCPGPIPIQGAPCVPNVQPPARAKPTFENATGGNSDALNHSYLTPRDVNLTARGLNAFVSANAVDPSTVVVFRLPRDAYSLAVPTSTSTGWQRTSDYVNTTDGRMQVEYRINASAPQSELFLRVLLEPFSPEACAPNTFELEISNTTTVVPLSIPFVCDREVPVIVQPEDVVAEATAPEGAEVAFDVEVTDDNTPEEAVCLPASGSTFPLGTTSVTCNAGDVAGNSAEPVTFDVTVVDTTAPSFDPVDDITLEATGPDGAAAEYDAPTWTDAVDGEGVADCAPAIGETLALGDHGVTCVATDVAGNVAEPLTFTITVADTTAPSFDEMVDLVVEAESPEGAMVDYDVPTWTDVVDVEGVADCEPAAGETFALGETTVTCFAIDAAGNEAEAAFLIEVVDTLGPLIEAYEDVTLEAEGPEGAVFDFEPPATADEVAGDGVATCDTEPGTLLPLGDHEVVCWAEDADGNVAEMAFLVSVVDTTAPAIEQPEDITVVATSADGAEVAFDAPGWTDAVDGEGVAECDLASGTYPVGASVVTCDATDEAGNAAAVSFTITVEPRPAALVLLEVDLPASRFLGNDATLTASIGNAGDLPGAATLRILVDGTEATSFDVDVAGGDIGSYETILTPSAGEHVVRVEMGETVVERTITIRDATGSITLSRSAFTVGREATLVATIRDHTGGLVTTADVELGCASGGECDVGAALNATPEQISGSGATGRGLNGKYLFAIAPTAAGTYVVHAVIGGSDDPEPLSATFQVVGEDEPEETPRPVSNTRPPPVWTPVAQTAGVEMDVPSSADASESVRVSAEASVAGASFEWLFDDGGSASGASATHTWTRAGTYTITLLANVDGQTVVETSTITIREPGEAAAPADEAGADAGAGEASEGSSGDDAAEATDEAASASVAPPTASAPSGVARSPATVAFDAPEGAIVFWRADPARGWTTGREAEIAGDGVVTIEYYALLRGLESERRTVTIELDGLPPEIAEVAADGGIGAGTIVARITDADLASATATLRGTRGEGEFIVPLVIGEDGTLTGTREGLPAGQYTVTIEAIDSAGRSSEHVVSEPMLVSAPESIEESSVEGASAGADVPGFGILGALAGLAAVALVARRRRA